MVFRFLMICCLFCVMQVQAVPLARKAFMGITFTPVPEGLRVDSAVHGSTAEALHLAKDDILLNINDSAVVNAMQYQQIAGSLRDKDKIRIHYLHNGKSYMAKGTVVPKPLEQSAAFDIIYDAVPFRGGLLRTITRKPKGKTHMPCILLIPGYGCGSIDNFSASYNGNLMKEWLSAGYAVVTIEKSGMGDSYHCVPCAEADLLMDIESFDAGYQYMAALDGVDTGALFIWGHSMGGVIAPEIAKRHHPKGVMVYGTVFRPWSEFLLEMHRVQKPLEGLSYQQTETFIRLIQKVYYEFFRLKHSPEQLHDNPEYSAIVSSELDYVAGGTNMWGRHWRFWQQLDELDLSVSWAQVNCPVLVMNGAADHEQCAAIEPILIEHTVNEAHPGYATRLELPGIDHFLMNSNSYTEAILHFKNKEYANGNFNESVSKETIRWMNAIRK